MAEKKEKVKRAIIGAVAVEGYDRAFVAGDEDALEEAIANDTNKVIDVAHLTKSGAIVGFGGDGEVAPAVVNRQRNADGSQADEEGVEGAEGAAAKAAKPRKTAVKASKAGEAKAAKRQKKVS